MKATIRNTKKEAFKPFTIELIVETLQEARALYHVFNVCDIAQIAYGHYEPEEAVNYSDDFEPNVGGVLYAEIEDAVQKQGFEI